jgi:hypothetical protein
MKQTRLFSVMFFYNIDLLYRCKVSTFVIVSVLSSNPSVCELERSKHSFVIFQALTVSVDEIMNSDISSVSHNVHAI